MINVYLRSYFYMLYCKALFKLTTKFFGKYAVFENIKRIISILETRFEKMLSILQAEQINMMLIKKVYINPQKFRRGKHHFFRLVRKFTTPKLLEKYFFSNFVLQALIGMKTILRCFFECIRCSNFTLCAK